MYEREQPSVRAAPARLYVHGEKILAFVSTAEIDAVERRLEGRTSSSNVQPAASGAVSFAARAPRLAASLSPSARKAARWLSEARIIRGSADLTSVEARVEIEVEFETAERARLAADASALLARMLATSSDNARRVVDTLHIEAVDATLVVRGKLPTELIAELSRSGRGRN
jgi:hypothetical protein